MAAPPNMFLPPAILQQQADAGDVEAQLALAMRFEAGNGVMAHPQLAFEYYNRAAEQGHPRGQLCVANCFFNGFGVDRDYGKAAVYFKLAAERGLPDGQYCYGNCLYNGIGIEKNLEKAAEFYRLAADQGHPLAQLVCGDCLMNGYGVAQDKQKAVEYYHLSAMQGNGMSMFKYGECLEKGDGAEQDLEKAREAYSGAAMRMIAEANPALARVTDELNRRRREADEAATAERASRRSAMTRYSLSSREPRRRSTPMRFDESKIGAGWVVDINSLEYIKDIGQGTFGVVRLMRSRENGEEFAVKTLNSIGTEEDQKVRFEREAQVLIAINHPCVLSIRGVIVPCPENDMRAGIVTRYLPKGSLANLLNSVRSGQHIDFWNHIVETKIICGIVLGMREIHSKSIIHRDLKPGNIILDENFHAQICDFGCSRFEDASMTKTPSLGTPAYMAPEMHSSNGQYTNAVDVFSFGVLLYEIIFNRRAFEGKEGEQIKQECVRGIRPSLEAVGSARTVHPMVLRMIEYCWAVDPSERPTFDDILDALDSIAFDVFDGVDRDGSVTAYVREVKKWEIDQRFPRYHP